MRPATPPACRPLVPALLAASLGAAEAPAQTLFDIAPPVTVDIGFDASPTSIDAGDLDEDGFVDLVLAARNNEGRVPIFFGGPGGFEVPPAELQLTGQTNWALIRDLNGDGHLDLAVSHRQGLGRVSVILGDGSRTLGEPVDHAAGRNPTPLRAADLDGDDDLDLVTFNWGTSDVSILFNDGAAGFSLVQTVRVNATAASAPSPTWAEIVDLDGDLDLDIASMSIGASSIVHLLFNQGDGTFDVPLQQAVAGIADDESIATLTAADFDGDGDVDLVTKAGDVSFADRIIVLANDGGGRFETASEIQLTGFLGGSPWEIAAGDFDGDEGVDLAWVSHVLSSQAVGFLRNEKTGVPTFATPEQVFFLGGFPRALLPADIDGDDDLDLVAANLTDHTVAVLENQLVQGVAAPGTPEGWRKPGRGKGFALATPEGWRKPDRGKGFALATPSLPILAGMGGPVCGKPDAGDCFEPHEGPGCDDEECCTLVCEQVPICCLTEWSQQCADVAGDICPEPPACPAEGGCYTVHEGSGCEDAACCELVCALDGFCCGGPWDQLCVEEAVLFCGLPAVELDPCPPNATPEPEDACTDRVNEGCNGSEPAFTPIACGEVVCGECRTFGNARDTDWYEITVDEPGELSWTMTSEFPAELHIVTGTCDDTFTVAASAYGLGGDSVSARLTVEPGTYYLFVAPGTERAALRGGIPCVVDDEPLGEVVFGSRYLATVSCGPGCAADLDGNGEVGIEDFLMLIAAWGSPGGPADFDGDGTVGLTDLLILIAEWGDCAA